MNKSLAVFLLLITLMVAQSCNQLREPSLPGEAMAVPSATAVQTYVWIVTEPSVPVTDTYDVNLGVGSLGSYLAYRTPSGAASSFNIKLFSEASGWSDVLLNFMTDYGSSSKWFSITSEKLFVVRTDALGYIYVYSKPAATGDFQLLGTNPIAGPGCVEATILSNPVMPASSGVEVVVAYIDTADNSRLRIKRIYDYYSLYDWYDATFDGTEPSVNRLNDKGSLALGGYFGSSGSLYLAYADGASNTVAGYGEAGGSSSSFYINPGSPVCGARGAVSYIVTGFTTTYRHIIGYSDAGLSGKAVIQGRLFQASEYAYMGGGPASDSGVKYLSLSTGSNILIAFADTSADDRLVVKRFNVSGWDNIGVPQEPIESCSVSVLPSPLRPCVAYTTTQALGRRLKFVYAE